MSVVNIIDGRKRPYRFLKVKAVVEAAWHDNSVKDADQVASRDGPDYDQREHVSLAAALAWGASFAADVTLYLHDEDGGIYEEEK
jgi:N-acetyl-beta-hexosaminidase